MAAYVGLDLGGNSINVTVMEDGTFLIPTLREIESLATDGPATCVAQLMKGFEIALTEAKIDRSQVAAVGLDTPGPASAEGVLSKQGTVNFADPGYKGFDIRGALAKELGLPVSYLNDGNAAALYAHYHRFGNDPTKTSVSLIIGTGLGGGIVTNGRVLVGRVGFAAENGHTRLPGDWHPTETFHARCNCGNTNDLESIVSLTGIELNLLPHFLPRYPDHPLHGMPLKQAAKKVRGLAEQGDPMATEIFRTQTYAIAAHIDLMVNLLDPDAIFIGGGGVEANEAFRTWYIQSIREATPLREEQRDLPIEIIPNGDMAGARGAAVYAAQKFGS